MLTHMYHVTMLVALGLSVTPLGASAVLSTSQRCLMEKGVKAYDEALFDEAVSYYQQLLDGIREGHDLDDDDDSVALSEEITLRLGQAYAAAGRYNDAIAALEAHPDALNAGASRLLATAYQEAGHPQRAIHILQNLQDDEALDQEGLWQLAHAHYQAGHSSAASELFLAFTPDSTPPRLYHLSQLYLARIAIDQHHYRDALKRLDALSKTMPPGDALQYELHFLSGDALYSLHNYADAIAHYERALPRRNPEKVDWSRKTQQRIASSYLAIADAADVSREQRTDSLKKAYDILQSLQQAAPDDAVWLALGKYYVVSGRRLDDPQALARAEAILTHTDLFTSREARAQALLLRAEAAATYRERDSLYRQLTDASQLSGSAYAQGWYLRGINDLSEAERLLAAGDRDAGLQLTEAAVHSLRRSFDLLTSADPALAGLAAKQAVKAYILINHDRANSNALRLLDAIVREYPQVVASATDPDEFLYLQAQLTAQQNEAAAVKVLDTLLQRYPTGRFADAALYLMATQQYRRGDIAAAQHSFERLTASYPQSSYAGEALYWQARCLESTGDSGMRYQELLRTVYTDFPNSPAAAEAYYSCYTPTEYLQGGPAALAHLEKMPTLFPDSPLAVQALLLIGLDNKRTRLSPEGKVLRKRNWNKAIQAFQDAEARFDALQQRGLVPPQDIDTFVALRYRANLERALANLSVATESEGAKKHIYLEYAIDMFDKLLAELQDPHNPLAVVVTRGEPYPPILEEASYHLAVANSLTGDDEASQKVLDQMLKHYEASKITRGYYLSRVHYQQARIAQRAGKFDDAIALLAMSEEAAKGKVLSSEEKLDLWLQRSECCRELGMLDSAMLELSRVINDDAISGQRIQAMYLRANLYELQGRPELALKQLEATAKKGGPWAAKAKDKLDRDYRYD